MKISTRTIGGLFIAMNAIAASAANYVVNPDFATDSSGWTLSATGSAIAAFDNTSGSPATGAMHLASTNGDIAQAHQCVAISGQHVDIRARQYVANEIPPVGEANYNVIGYDGANCTGAPTVGLIAVPTATTFPGFLGGAAQTWQGVAYLNQPLPPATVSAYISLYVRANASGAADYYFDSVELTPAGTTPVTLQTFDVE